MLFSRPLIAIDIGSSAIKLVELSGSSSSKLRSVGIEMMPAGVVEDGMIQDAVVVGTVLKRLIRRLSLGTFGRRIAVALSGSSVMIKKIYITPKKDVGFEEQIFFEAEQNFQHDMSDLYYNHYVIKGLPRADGKVPVALVGAKRELVEQYVELMRSVGFRVGVIDCAVFAAGNMFEFNYGLAQGLVGLVNVGAALTQVSLYLNGEYLYTREFAIGGEEYTKKLIEVLGIDRVSAEKTKIAVSLGKVAASREVLQAIEDVSQALANEIQMTTDYFFQSSDVPQGVSGISHFFLTGGGAQTLGLDATIAAALQLPVHVISPFRKCDMAGSKVQFDFLSTQGHHFGVAMGLALRRINDEAN